MNLLTLRVRYYFCRADSGRAARRTLGVVSRIQFGSSTPELQMVPRSMNGAYSDGGSYEFFAISLPDVMYPERKSYAPVHCPVYCKRS